MALSCHQRIMNNICQARPISLTQWLFSMAQLQLPVRERNWSSSIDLVWICKLYFDAELGWATCMYSLSFSIGTHEWSGCSSLCPENVTGSQTELDPWHCNNFQYHHHHHHHHLHHLTIITTSLSSPPHCHHHLTTSPPHHLSVVALLREQSGSTAGSILWYDVKMVIFSNDTWYCWNVTLCKLIMLALAQLFIISFVFQSAFLLSCSPCDL